MVNKKSHAIDGIIRYLGAAWTHTPKNRTRL